MLNTRPGFLNSLVMFCVGVTAVFSGLFVVLAVAYHQDEKNGERFVYPDQNVHHNPEFHRRNPEFNHGFQHDPEFHRNHPLPPNFNDGRDLRNRNDEGVINDNATMEIPLDFALNLSEYDDHNEILMKFVEGGEDHVEKRILYSTFGEAPIIGVRFGDTSGDNSERDSAQIPKSAQCMPELQTVKIAQSDNPSILYIPQCTRIERCGGCCSHPLLSCQPKETETVTFKVTKTEYVGASKLKYVGKELVVVEKHTKCKCGCKVKAEDCNLHIQEYLEGQCKCVCKNLDEEKKCYKQMPRKLWNPEICACQCREIMPCSYGYQFDYNECRCVQAAIKRRYLLKESAPYEPMDQES